MVRCTVDAAHHTIGRNDVAIREDRQRSAVAQDADAAPHAKATPVLAIAAGVLADAIAFDTKRKRTFDHFDGLHRIEIAIAEGANHGASIEVFGGARAARRILVK